MVLVAGLSSLRLGQRPFVLDEELSLAHAQETWGGVLRGAPIPLDPNPNMGLYFAILKIWTGIFGDSVVAVRSLSVVAAVMCVPVVYALGARLFGTPAGLLAGVLLSTNVFFLEYAQVARSYALVTLLVALSSYFFVAELERPQMSSRAGYVAFSALAFYAHVFAIWVILVQLLTLAAFKRREVASRRWLTTFGLVGVLIAPIAYAMQRAGGSGLYWVEDPDLGSIPATYAQLAGNSFLHLAIVAVACALALRVARHSKPVAFGLVFTFSWAVLPTLATFVTSEVIRPTLVARYLIVSLPAFVLLAAGAIVNVRPVRAAVVAGSLLIALSLPELHRYYDWPA